MGSKLSPAYRSSRLATRRQTTTCWGVGTTSGGRRRLKLGRLDFDLDPGTLLAVWTRASLAGLGPSGEGKLLVVELEAGRRKPVNPLAVGLTLAGFLLDCSVNQVQLGAHSQEPSGNKGVRDGIGHSDGLRVNLGD
jgi:hypothetical protein